MRIQYIGTKEVMSISLPIGVTSKKLRSGVLNFAPGEIKEVDDALGKEILSRNCKIIKGNELSDEDRALLAKKSTAVRKVENAENLWEIKEVDDALGKEILSRNCKIIKGNELSDEDRALLAKKSTAVRKVENAENLYARQLNFIEANGGHEVEAEVTSTSEEVSETETTGKYEIPIEPLLKKRGRPKKGE